MAKARALDKRRKSIRNIRKITRTMELIATAKFKKAMDRATAATAYTKKITEVVAGLAKAGLKVSHPLLESHPETKNATLLILTANRGLNMYITGKIDRLDVAYVKFVTSSRQVATVETLLPLDSITGAEAAAIAANKAAGGKTAGDVMYEFMPSAESILEEVVPASF